ncbi:hypothetical protein CYMTET_26589, partial [Cymbomonas tetramitiformis]
MYLNASEVHTAVRSELRRFLQLDPQELLSAMTQWAAKGLGAWQLLRRLSNARVAEKLSPEALKVFLLNWSAWVFNELAQLQAHSEGGQHATFTALFTTYTQLQSSCQLDHSEVLFAAFQELSQQAQKLSRLSAEIEALRDGQEQLRLDACSKLKAAAAKDKVTPLPPCPTVYSGPLVAALSYHAPPAVFSGRVRRMTAGKVQMVELTSRLKSCEHQLALEVETRAATESILEDTEAILEELRKEAQDRQRQHTEASHKLQGE